jgi:hypothetical protein
MPANEEIVVLGGLAEVDGKVGFDLHQLVTVFQ